MRRVVITGMGALTPAGKNVAETWDKVLKGETAIDTITRFDISNFKVSLAAEVKEFNPELFVEEKREVRRLDRYSQYALAAVHEAVEDSGLDFKSEDSTLDKTRCGIIFGSGIGGIETLEAEITKFKINNDNGGKGPARVPALYIPMLISNIAAGYISMKYGLEGHGFCPVTACATSTHAIGEAFRAIKHGYADIIITGGSEAGITPTAIAGFQNATAMSQAADKTEALLPFDKRRNGFIMGEGAGALILESYESAAKRGAHIHAEVVGYCANFDAYHITAPEPSGKGARNAILSAIADAQIDKTKIDYINAHGTGTEINDKTETLAMKTAFGDHAYKLAVSSTKAVVGHMLGAAGAVEAICSIKAITDNVLPPTANLREADPECDLDYVPLTARERNIDYALSTSMGFGSTNAVVIFKKV